MAVFRFAIARYVPDPVRDERLNVGVILASDDPAYFGSRFLKANEFGRLRRLAGAGDPAFVTDLAKSLAASARSPDQLNVTNGWTLETVESASREWANIVQFSELRTLTAKQPEEALDQLYAAYVGVARGRTRARDKRWVRSKISRSLRAQVASAGLDPDDVVHRNERVDGKFESHIIDYVLGGNEKSGLAQALSLEATDRRAAKKEIDVVAWTIDDILKADSTVPISVLTVGNGGLTGPAQKIYEGLGAQMVQEPEFESWVEETAKDLVATHT